MINRGFIIKVIFTLYFAFLSINNKVVASDTLYYEIWELNSLDSIGGHSLTVLGNPEVVSTDIGDAVKFNGNGDMLLVDNNPLGDAKAFTVEVIFKPDAGINIQNEPRFIHIGEASNERVMMEIRVNNNDEWYLDGFMKTDMDDLTLIDDAKTHPTNDWMHAAITYSNNKFTTYVNGEEELSDRVGYSNLIVKTVGQTSIGARMNEQNWYCGLIKTIKITHAALLPDDFIKIEKETDTIENNPTNINFTFLEHNLIIYPNPADQFIYILINKQIKKSANISITNILGKQILVFNLNLNNKVNTLDISELEKGLYLINIKAGNEIFAKKIIIKH